MKKIKIFQAYHKDSVRISSDILTPIHVGRALAKENVRNSLNDIIGDNTGDNISSKNPNYCELTAQYWAWKNCDADYIGFMHYRRHLNFNIKQSYHEDMWGLVSEKFYSDDYIKKFGLSDDNIQDIVTKYDIITVNPWDVTNAGTKSLYDHYASSNKKLFIKDYDNALDILKEMYPDYIEDADSYNYQKLGWFTNIFIMKKEIFEEYCSWLFSILFKLEKNTDISSYDFQEARIYGYISEWLFGIFIAHKKRIGGYSIKELQRTFIEYTDKIDNEDIHVCLSSDNRFAQHLGVTIASIVHNKKKSDRIHLYILDGGITNTNKKKICSIIQDNNINIEFICINNSSFCDFPIYTIKDTHISIATYYRLMISKLLPHLDKVLYLDSDIVVKDSLYSLYHIPMNDNYFMGAIDILCNANAKRLGLKKYVNAGVILLNLKKFREDNLHEKLFEFVVKQKHRILYHDQDVLNSVLQEHMAYIDKAWNAQTCEYKDSWSDGWNELGKRASIIHFISDKKPWALGNRHPFQHEYFHYLKLTPWKHKLPFYMLISIISKCYHLQKTEKNTRLFILGLQVFKKTISSNKHRYSILGIHVFSKKVKG